MVWTLLDSGVEVDMKIDKLGETALMVASQNGYANVVGLLLHHGAEVPRRCTALFLAAREGHAATVQMLLDAGADPNTRHNYPDIEKQWGTALNVAARSGSAETVRVLLDQPSIDADALDDYGEPAIRTASARGHIDCVQLLSERNLPLEHLNDAATAAWDGGYDEIVHMLVAKGATATNSFPMLSDPLL
jgi:ankyrin repeat protein